MYAVVATGGKQVKVAEGDVIRVEKIDAEIGSKVELADVKMLGLADGPVLDADALSKAKVVCEVTGQDRRKKIRIFKMKRRKNYRRAAGHRQAYTELKVEKIQG